MDCKITGIVPARSAAKPKNNLPEEARWVWNARWSSYWYGDRELFESSAADFNRKASALRRAGINAVITFGGFHFRWNFIAEWPQLIKTLKLICKSCHQHGIRVVEHHSAILQSFPIGAREWADVGKYFNNGVTDASPVEMKRHPLVLRMLETGDYEFSGVKLSNMRQIDPRTGSYARTAYQGWALCYNNPDWQRIYFEHLEKLYACGIDGIMTDDIGFWPSGYGCGCLHCRRLFEEETGCRMPPNGQDDSDYYGNFTNAVYRRWLDWRIGQQRKHQERLFAHFRSRGYELARPIYSSSDTNSYRPVGVGSSLSAMDGLFSTIFTEVNANDLQAHCWLRIGAEASQRSALARRNAAPAMCLFYPNNKVENEFCWGMTKLWGQNYWGTNPALTLHSETRMLSPYFRFEKSHPELYGRPESIAEIGIVYSARTVLFHRDADAAPDPIIMSDPSSTDCWAGWCETILLHGMPFDTLLEREMEENDEWMRYKVLVLPNVVCMSHRVTQALLYYVHSGGRLIITHQTGMKDETGKWKSKHPFERLLHAVYGGVRESDSDWVPAGGRRDLSICRVTKIPIVVWREQNGVEVLMRVGGKSLAIGRVRHGNGEVVFFAGKPGRIVCVNRHRRYDRHGQRYAAIAYRRNAAVMRVMWHVLEELNPKPLLRMSEKPRRIAVGLYQHGARLALHIMNIAGVMADDSKKATIPAPLRFPRLDKLPGGLDEIVFAVRTSKQHAYMHAPSARCAKSLKVSRAGEYLEIYVTSRHLGCYQVIEIK